MIIVFVIIVVVCVVRLRVDGDAGGVQRAQYPVRQTGVAVRDVRLVGSVRSPRVLERVERTKKNSLLVPPSPGLSSQRTRQLIQRRSSLHWVRVIIHVAFLAQRRGHGRGEHRRRL